MTNQEVKKIVAIILLVLSGMFLSPFTHYHDVQKLYIGIAMGSLFFFIGYLYIMFD